MEDSKIIDLYWERSEDAIAESQHKYGPYCGKIALNILADLQDSEECVSDTFLKAWGAIPPNRPNCLRTFLGRITRNLALDRYDKNHADKRGGGELAICLDELSECIGTESDAQKQLESAELTAILDRFLAAQRPEIRKMFVRRYWYMDSITGIAERYGFTVSKVKTALSRARAELKIELAKEGY